MKNSIELAKYIKALLWQAFFAEYNHVQFTKNAKEEHISREMKKIIKDELYDSMHFHVDLEIDRLVKTLYLHMLSVIDNGETMYFDIPDENKKIHKLCLCEYVIQLYIMRIIQYPQRAVHGLTSSDPLDEEILSGNQAVDMDHVVSKKENKNAEAMRAEEIKKALVSLLRKMS
jgi:hypothetical protein